MRHTLTLRRRFGWAFITAGLGAAAGCSSSSPSFDAREYPSGREQLVLEEATVTRLARRLTITNNSHQTLGPGRMWVNQEFSHPIEAIMSGEMANLDLREFRNEFGEQFRAGGFWATERPKRLGLVQIEPEGNGNRMQGLVVVHDVPQ